MPMLCSPGCSEAKSDHPDSGRLLLWGGALGPFALAVQPTKAMVSDCSKRRGWHYLFSLDFPTFGTAWDWQSDVAAWMGLVQVT